MKISMKCLALVTLSLLAKMHTFANAENFDIETVQTEIGKLKSSGQWPKGASTSIIEYLTSIGQWPLKTSESTTLVASGTSPSNDSCLDPTEITILPFYSSGFTTFASSQNGIALKECGEVDYDGGPAVWYKVTGTGGTITATTLLPTDFDTRLHVYSGTCKSLVCVTGHDDTWNEGAPFLSTVTWDSSPCEEYYILLHSFGGTGTYFLEVISDTTLPVCSEAPSMVPSESLQPSSEPSSWLDDEQCKKKKTENDVCAELNGRCKVDCENDENFVCVPGLCSYDRNWDKPTKSPKMRALMDEVDVVDIEVSADGQTERKLKATKAPKSSCACKVPRKRGCEN